MTEEQILSTLTERLGQNSLSQRTLTDYVHGNLPAEGTEPDDAYFNRHVTFLKSLNGNYSHDVALQVEEFKKNDKPAPQKDEKPGQEPEPKETKPKVAISDDFMKRLESLEAQLADERAKAAISSLKSSAVAEGKRLNVSNSALWNDAVELVKVTENMTADSMVKEAKAIYEQKLKAYMGDGAVPYGGKPATTHPAMSDKAASDARERFKEQMRSSGRLPKKS